MRWVMFAVALGAIWAAGCGDDSHSPDSDGGAVADGAAGVDSGGTAIDSGPGRDAGPAGAGDHTSYVPPGLTPEVATRLIVLGDSISAGSGASSGGLVYHALLANNDDGAHPSESGNDLEALTGGTVQIVDVARGGASTRNLGGQVDQVRRDISPPVNGHTIVVLTIGGNDLQSAIAGGDPTGSLLDGAIANIRSMVEFFQDPMNFRDGTSIYIADVYDPSDGVGQIPGPPATPATCFFGLDLTRLLDALPVWRDRYIELGTEMGFAVIDIFGHFHGHGFYFEDMSNEYYDAADPTLWFNDCIHPNDAGHHEIRRVFYEAMDPAVMVE